MHKMLFGQLQIQTCSQSEKPTQIPALSEKFDYAEHSKLERFLKVNVRTQVSIIHSKQPYSANGIISASKKILVLRWDQGSDEVREDR